MKPYLLFLETICIYKKKILFLGNFLKEKTRLYYIGFNE